jgi:hypothetical protein
MLFIVRAVFPRIYARLSLRLLARHRMPVATSIVADIIRVCSRIYARLPLCPVLRRIRRNIQTIAAFLEIRRKISTKKRTRQICGLVSYSKRLCFLLKTYSLSIGYPQ